LIFFCGFIFVLFGILAALPFIYRDLGKGSIWLALLAGMLIYLLIVFIQQPLQNCLFQFLSEDVSLAWRSFLLAFLAGLLQESLKLLGLWGYSIPFSREKILHFGVMLGLGFALGESFYILYQISGLTYSLPSFVFFLDRCIIILFHLSLGGLLAYGLKKKSLAWIYPLVVFIHTGFVYLSLLHQDKVIGLWLTESIVGVLSLIAYGAVIALYLNREKRELHVAR